MTELSAPWDGVTLGDAALAPYSAVEWAAIWRDILINPKADHGPILGSGTSPDIGLTTQATGPASAAVDVTAGAAFVRGTWYSTDATVTLPIGANASGNARIDTVVLRKDFAAQTVRLAVLPGTPAITPAPPALTQTDGVLWEIPLADIAVANGFATIGNGDITPNRHFANIADGVYLNDVLNNSGGTLATGDVVVWDSTANRAVKTSTTIGNKDIAGVWVGRTGAGGYGRMLTHGIGYVNCNGAVATRLAVLIPYNVAKQAVAVAVITADTQSRRNAIGISLTTTAGTGLCLALVDIGAQQKGAIVQTESANTSTSTSVTFVDSAAGHQISITPHGTRVRVTFQFSGNVQTAGKFGYWDVYSVGLSARAAASANGTLLTGDTIVGPLTLVAIFTGLTPGTAQVFKLQHRTSDGASYVATNAVLMLAEEI